jgi:hypothetical protein
MQVVDFETTVAPWNRLYKARGVAALLVGVLFLAGLVDLILTGLGAETAARWLSLAGSNWLVVLFQLNAGFSGVEYGLLYQLNPLDIAILALAGIAFLGLYVALRSTSKIWSLIAVIQPFLGIVLFVATKTAGRSAIMGATLVISLVMLRSHLFSRLIACIGLFASVLLLAGDMGTTPGSQSSILALFIAVGYVLLTTWYFVIGRRLLHLGQALTPHVREQRRVD